jgi:predicted metal-binding protein
MDKVLLKFFADVLYLKEQLCSEELEDIYEAKTPIDLDNIFEKMMRGEYNVYKRGETYANYGKHRRDESDFDHAD